jgi:hypothetical protein
VPAVDYDEHGYAYTKHRRADPRIRDRIHAALGDARTVLNVGTRAGSYGPDDRWVLAVEPSATMGAQRPPSATPAIAARAAALPLDDEVVDAAMACVTIQHWEPPEALLDPDVRASRSMWKVVGPRVEQRIVRRLRVALESGGWDAEHGHLRRRDSFEGCLRLVVSER